MGRKRAGAVWQTWVQGGKVVAARDVATAPGKAGKGGGHDGLVYTSFSPSFTHASHWPSLMESKWEQEPGNLASPQQSERNRERGWA